MRVEDAQRWSTRLARVTERCLQQAVPRGRPWGSGAGRRAGAGLAVTRWYMVEHARAAGAGRREGARGCRLGRTHSVAVSPAALGPG